MLPSLRITLFHGRNINSTDDQFFYQVCWIFLYISNDFKPFSPWWRHQMETFSALLAICAVNSPVNSPHKGQWRGALMFTLICARINGWVNNREAGDLRRYRTHCDVIVMHSDLRVCSRASRDIILIHIVFQFVSVGSTGIVSYVSV